MEKINKLKEWSELVEESEKIVDSFVSERDKEKRKEKILTIIKERRRLGYEPKQEFVGEIVVDETSFRIDVKITDENPQFSQKVFWGKIDFNNGENLQKNEYLIFEKFVKDICQMRKKPKIMDEGQSYRWLEYNAKTGQVLYVFHEDLNEDY